MDGDWQPLHADRDAECFVERRDDPVAQDRLVQPREVIECRTDEIAALNHLARRLDVERFVRIPNRRPVEVYEVRQNRRRKEHEERQPSRITNH